MMFDKFRANRRERAARDADAHTHEPAGGLEGPARPGTTETGRPDRDQIGSGDREDLRESITGSYEPPAAGTHTGTTADFSGEQAMSRAKPSETPTHRQDQKELTGQRAQTGGRSGMTETDTQGSQQTRRHVGLETEPQHGGRTVPAEPAETEPTNTDEDVEKRREQRREAELER